MGGSSCQQPGDRAPHTGGHPAIAAIAATRNGCSPKLSAPVGRRVGCPPGADNRCPRGPTPPVAQPKRAPARQADTGGSPPGADTSGQQRRSPRGAPHTSAASARGLKPALGHSPKSRPPMRATHDTTNTTSFPPYVAGGVSDASGVGRGCWGGLASLVPLGVWAGDRYWVVFSVNGGIGYGLIDSCFDFVQWCL